MTAPGPNPPVVDPALYSQQDRPDQDIASRLHDQFFPRPSAGYYPAYHPQDHAHPTADNTEAALQAIATAAQHDRRASSASSASAGGAVKADGHSQTKLGPDGKRLRACDHCRALKVRCDPQEENGLISEIYPCRRCLKSKKTCITTAPAKKRTKKADTRVAELEKKVNELTARLGDAPMPPFAAPGPAAAAMPEGHCPVDYLESPVRPEKRRRISEYTDVAGAHEMRKDLLAASQHGTDTRVPQSDPSYICYEIDRCLSPDTVGRILHRYVHVMAPSFPAVPLPLDTTASKLREEKPLLLLSILNSASYGIEPLVPAETQRHLSEVLQSWFAELIWRRQDKSLEIVQALQVCVLWYRPPPVFDRHAFYMMSNAATTMVLELGLGKRAGNAQAKLGLAPYRVTLPNAGAAEARRAYAMCYYMGTNISMILRRPMMLRWNKYMDECITELESAPDALPSDKILCHRLKLAAIAEEVASQFAMDDPAESPNLLDKSNENALKAYEARLESLRQQRPVHADQAMLKYYEHVLSLYMHEIAMQHDQNVDETAEEGRPNSSDPAQVKCLQEGISACHGILDNFLSFTFDEFYILPLMHCESHPNPTILQILT
ncbi:C6 zinc finger domain-containing protein [Phyllosticta citricarpa]